MMTNPFTIMFPRPYDLINRLGDVLVLIVFNATFIEIDAQCAGTVRCKALPQRIQTQG